MMNTEPYLKPKSIAELAAEINAAAKADRTPMPPDIYGVNRTRFASWDRINLERLAEELVAELNETKEELRAALKHWRMAVKDCSK